MLETLHSNNKNEMNTEVYVHYIKLTQTNFTKINAAKRVTPNTECTHQILLKMSPLRLFSMPMNPII